MSLKSIGIKGIKKFNPIVEAKPNKQGSISRMSNFYTGKRLNPLVVGGVGAAYLAGTNGKHAIEKNSIEPLRLATQRDVQHLGAPDIMMYDGVGQDKAPSNLNANGSIVFGLHNMRRG
ncbi:hypothetical protein [Cytobacillus oceanisediminis]|uniref:hypothetical protein n=1 Tax=Cytobacillus oceanisediminis TaxID=665099 RepID=UPI001FB3D925|nr:hypothetical protein [Cytobacillus oceanisediminis]UOE58097.1 hypothetical protein IRB79_26665 [Cytobacillus oceanisediminis]